MKHDKRSFRFLRTACAFLLAAAMLLSAGCSLPFFKDAEQDNTSGTGTTSDDGYDVVLLLDESSSLSTEQIALRNKAAYAFISTMTDDCRLGAIFFSMKDNETVELASLKDSSQRKKLLNLFSGKTARIVRQTEKEKNGTKLNVALQKGLELLKPSPRKNKAIVFFTDGLNTPKSKRNSVDNATRRVTTTALTAGNGDTPVPVYVVYLHQNDTTQTDAPTQSEALASLNKCFGTDGHPAAFIDASSNDSDWEKVRWSDTSVNKIIYTDNANDLTNVFPKLFYEIRNIGSQQFSVRPDASGKVTVEFYVPDMAASGVQLIASSSKKMTPEKIVSIDGNESYMLDSGDKGYDAGQIYVDTVTAKKNNLTPGRWQLEFTASATVTGSIAILGDFSGQTAVRQGKEIIESLASFTDATIEVSLLNAKGKPISLTDGVTAYLQIDENDLAEDILREMIVEDTTIISHPLRFAKEKTIPYTIAINYNHMLYSVDGEIVVHDAPPVIHLSETTCTYTEEQHIGQYVDIGPLSKYVSDAKDGETLTVDITDDAGDEPIKTTVTEMAKQLGLPVPFEDSPERHLFVRDTEGTHHLTVKATDSSGSKASGEIALLLESTATVNARRRHIFRINLLIIFTLAAAAIILLLIRRYRQYLASPRHYNVLAELTTGEGAEPVVAAISSRDTLFDNHGIRINFRKQPFRSMNGKFDTAKHPLPLLLDLGKNRIILQIPLRVALKDFARSRFTVESTASGDVTARKCRRCKLSPNKSYLIRYNGFELRLRFSRADTWTGIVNQM